MTDARIAVFGAAGHTGKFVVSEIERRGFRPIRIGRDRRTLAAADAPHREPARVAQVDDPASLDAALSGADVVINCAGPFLDTAIPIADAAIRAGIPYLDVAAEQAAVQSLFHTRSDVARESKVLILPSAAFYGGLADLLATAAAGSARPIEAIDIAVGLDSWHPTQGTRLTGQRNTAPRLVQRQGRLQTFPAPAPAGRWNYPDPIGPRDVLMLPFSETITLASHLNAETIESWINVEAIRDIRDPGTPPPRPADESGRSSQHFVLDVTVVVGGVRRRATARGRDIYHVSASIIVEAAQRVLAKQAGESTGVRSLGDVFDARSFLAALEPEAMRISYEDDSSALLERELASV